MFIKTAPKRALLSEAILVGGIVLTGMLSGCVSFDKERVAKQRQADLCRHIDSQNLPECPGHHAPMPPSLD